jgi:hypothetical protein
MAADSIKPEPEVGRVVAVSTFLLGLIALGVSVAGLLTGEPGVLVALLAVVGLSFCGSVLLRNRRLRQQPPPLSTTPDAPAGNRDRRTHL